MKTIVFVLLSLLSVCTNAVADTFGSGLNQFEIEFVKIGNPGNAADTTGDPNPAGRVDYVYNIGKFEISRDVVTKANAQSNLEVILDDFEWVTAAPRPDMPATNVNWNEAARFVNWLNASQGHSAAYKFGSQPGDVGYDVNANIELWEAGDPGFNAGNPFRNSLARYFLPSEDEWYKAAYYDPNANGGAGDYWNFQNGSDNAPMPVASGTDAGTAVYGQWEQEGPADITQAGGLSPYGVMGLGGNVVEWQETEFDLVNDDSSGVRVLKGGDWFFSNGLSASFRIWRTPITNEDLIGLRVASIPEPNVLDPLADCNGDGVLNAADLACVITISARDDVLEALNSLPGDFDGDGKVAFGDFLVLSANFGQEEASYADGNINLTDGINFADFLVLSNNFGKSALSLSAVPEPGTLSFLVLAALGLFPLRRRQR